MCLLKGTSKLSKTLGPRSSSVLSASIFQWEPESFQHGAEKHCSEELGPSWPMAGGLRNREPEKASELFPTQWEGFIIEAKTETQEETKSLERSVNLGFSCTEQEPGRLCGGAA